jgi:hypothetical protein
MVPKALFTCSLRCLIDPPPYRLTIDWYQWRRDPPFVSEFIYSLQKWFEKGPGQPDGAKPHLPSRSHIVQKCDEQDDQLASERTFTIALLR